MYRNISMRLNQIVDYLSYYKAPSKNVVLHEPLSCPICLEEASKGTCLPCGHGFHEHCYVQYFLQSNDATIKCPMCRETCDRHVRHSFHVEEKKVKIEPIDLTTPDPLPALEAPTPVSRPRKPVCTARIYNETTRKTRRCRRKQVEGEQRCMKCSRDYYKRLCDEAKEKHAREIQDCIRDHDIAARRITTGR